MPPDSYEPIKVTFLSGAWVAQHGVKTTSLGAVWMELQAPKPRTRAMEKNAIVSFISVMRIFMPNLVPDDKPLCSNLLFLFPDISFWI